jgi:hypothetical protein
VKRCTATIPECREPDDDRARCQLDAGHDSPHRSLGFHRQAGAKWSGKIEDLAVMWSDKPIKVRRIKVRRVQK